MFLSGPIKRPASGLSYTSPPTKKPNIQDVKEYTEAHRQRKEIVAEEFDDDPEYVDEGFVTESTQAVKIKRESENIDDKHTKIIHDVLKKYPHLVKNKQNIKLKITKQNTTHTVTAPVKQTPPPPTPVAKPIVALPAAPGTAKKIDSKKMHALIALGAENMEGPWLCLRCGVNGRPISIPSYKGFRRHLIGTHKEKIDPRICEHCGFKVNKRPDLHYHCLIKHNIKPPQNVVFPKCDECQYIAPDVAALLKHRETHHKTKNLHHCIYCNKTFSNEMLVYNHIRNNHKERACEDGVMDFDDDEILDESNQYVPNNETSPSGSNRIKILSNIELPLHTVASQDINLEPSSEAEGLSNVATGIATSLGVLDSSDELHYMDTGVVSTEPHEGDCKSEQTDDVTVTQFITEDGSLSTLQLTPSQKADLVRQMENQEGVVMILNDDFDHSQEMIVNNPEQQGIVVVYSQADDVPKDNVSQGATISEGDAGQDGNGSSLEDDFKMENEREHDDSDKKRENEKDNKDTSDMDIEQNADHSSLDSTFEHSLDEDDYEETEKTDDDGKDESADKATPDEKVVENDKKDDITDKKEIKKLISEVKDDWFDDEDEAENPKVEKNESKEKDKVVDNKNADQPATIVAPKVEKTYKNAGKKGSGDKETSAIKSAPAEPKLTRATRSKVDTTKNASKQSIKEKTVSKSDATEPANESLPKEDDKPVVEKLVESAEKKESKTDVKTLISADWGDDDF